LFFPFSSSFLFLSSSSSLPLFLPFSHPQTNPGSTRALSLHRQGALLLRNNLHLLPRSRQDRPRPLPGLQGFPLRGLRRQRPRPRQAKEPRPNRRQRSRHGRRRAEAPGFREVPGLQEEAEGEGEAGVRSVLRPDAQEALLLSREDGSGAVEQAVSG